MIEVWTDGCTLKNPGPAAWSAVIVYGTRHRVQSGYIGYATIGRAELMAVLKGLQFFQYPTRLKFFVDAQWIPNAFTQNWIDGWQRKGFKDIQNPDLWREVIPLAMECHTTEWEWVKGHSDLPYNEMAHDAAYRAAIEGQAWEMGSAASQEMDAEGPDGASNASLTLIQGGRTPETAEANIEPPVGGIPDPPQHKPLPYWAVFKRERGDLFLKRPTVLPMSPSGCKNGTCEEEMKAVAKKLNRGMFHVKPKYVAMPFRWAYGEGEFRVTQEEIDLGHRSAHPGGA